MTQKDKVLNCSNCRIGDFKQSLCDCHNGFCAKYKGIGTEKDFFMAIDALTKQNHETDAEVRVAVTDRNKDRVVLLDAFGELEYYPAVIADRPMWETCFACPLSNCCPKIQGATNEDAQKYASEVPKGCPIDRPHGEWIETTSGTICSNCGEYPYDDGEYHIANWHSDFCPSCGADMRQNK